MAGKFRQTKFDPIMIISQIAAMQCLLYLSAIVLMTVIDVVSGENFVLDQLFEYRQVHVSNAGVILTYLVNALVGALLLWIVVRRTKLCLDFSFTWHLFHLIICWWYSQSFPTTFSWWLLNIACATLMCITGEFLCLKTELQEIPVGYLKLTEV
ncbi:protein SYS1 homolog [Culicoides brevitarsis]|uniref:protein SYS1 homolog n=1 Tax=Culicoides brevitarsis TaxID=469753 RepID=UPI00307B5EE1